MSFKINNLGPCTITSPLLEKEITAQYSVVSDSMKVLYNVIYDENKKGPLNTEEAFEMAGPRGKIFFDPTKTRCAIVTCGGLCPGLNDVIRSVVMEAWYRYGVRNILGIRYGYQGLLPGSGYDPIELTPDFVRDIHRHGGSILGSSSGGTDDLNLQVDILQKLKIDILFTVGGDGTLRGANGIAEIALQRGLNIAVVGIPKTIDNDISFIQRSFGLETAMSVAAESITSAHVEAEGAYNGIGMVKVMGRQSGFIAAHAAIANNDVNFVLVPEVPFHLDGENGLLAHLEQRINRRHHAVICLAEGAGQNLLETEKESAGMVRDKSGNIKLKDIGLYLKEEIEAHFRKKKIEMTLKYIDPSYIIRSAPTVPDDSKYCTALGQYAVHAGMAGKTGVLIGQWNNLYTHVPIKLAISRRNVIDPQSLFWDNVVSATGQPLSMVN
jgi:6-phosphofructokinase 1